MSGPVTGEEALAVLEVTRSADVQILEEGLKRPGIDAVRERRIFELRQAQLAVIEAAIRQGLDPETAIQASIELPLTFKGIFMRQHRRDGSLVERLFEASSRLLSVLHLGAGVETPTLVGDAPAPSSGVRH